MAMRFVLLVFQWCIYMLVAFRLQQLWGYTGIAYEAPGSGAILLSLLSLAAVAALLSSRLERPSQGVMWLLASFVVVPTLSVAASNPNYELPTKLLASSSILLGFIIVAVISKAHIRPFKRTPKLSPNPNLYAGVITGLALLGISTVILGYGLAEINLSFDNVYERRLELRDAEPPYPGANYIMTWLKSPMAGALLVLGIAWKKRYLLVLAIASVLVIFSLTGEKSAFVFPLVAGAALWAARTSSVEKNQPIFGMAISAIISLPVAIAVLIPRANLDYLVTRRFGLVPGSLSHDYVDFATAEGFTRFYQSWLRLFAPPGESTTLGSRVGAWFGSLDLNANANPFAEGYASAGYFGVAVNAVLLGLILLLMDKLAISRARALSISLLVPVGFAYVNGYIHTSLLTGGVLLALALVWFLPKQAGNSLGRRGTAPPPEHIPTKANYGPPTPWNEHRAPPVS